MSSFSTNPPPPEKIDYVIGVIRAAVTAVPLVGGSITELFSAFFSTPVAKGGTIGSGKSPLR